MAGTFLSSLIDLLSSHPACCHCQRRAEAAVAWLGWKGGHQLGQKHPRIALPTQSCLEFEGPCCRAGVPETKTMLKCREKAGTPLGCQEHVHGGSGDLLSVKCQCQCNKDGTL